MITAKEIIEDLIKIEKKVEYCKKTFTGNDIWPIIKSKLRDTISTLKSDKAMYHYD